MVRIWTKRLDVADRVKILATEESRQRFVFDQFSLALPPEGGTEVLALRDAAADRVCTPLMRGTLTKPAAHRSARRRRGEPRHRLVAALGDGARRRPAACRLQTKCGSQDGS